MHRAIDTTTLDGAKRERPVVFVYHETDGLDIVDFKTDVQLNGYAGCLRDYGATKLGDPFDILAGRYPAAPLKALRKFYGREAAALLPPSTTRRWPRPERPRCCRSPSRPGFRFTRRPPVG